MNDTVWSAIKIDDDDDVGYDDDDDEDIWCSVGSTKYATFAVHKEIDFMKKCNKSGMYQYYW